MYPYTWHILRNFDSRPLLILTTSKQHDELEDLYQQELLRLSREKKLNRIV